MHNELVGLDTTVHTAVELSHETQTRGCPLSISPSSHSRFQLRQVETAAPAPPPPPPAGTTTAAPPSAATKHPSRGGRTGPAHPDTICTAVTRQYEQVRYSSRRVS